jgi:hypothetical protein
MIYQKVFAISVACIAATVLLVGIEIAPSSSIEIRGSVLRVLRKTKKFPLKCKILANRCKIHYVVMSCIKCHCCCTKN